MIATIASQFELVPVVLTVLMGVIAFGIYRANEQERSNRDHPN